MSGRRFLSEEAFGELREIRARRPQRIARAHRERQRRPLDGGDGRLLIIAADHPARGALGVRGNAMAMADRYDLLDRIAAALSRPGVDGVLGTPDIIDDLALLGLLGDRIAIGSMNRGGLRGASFEMDDRFTAYDMAGIQRDGLDMAKTLLRIDLDDPGTARTLERTAHAISEAAGAGVPIMIEPFMSTRREGRVVNELTADAVITSIAIAAGLGPSSASSWLKLPVVEDMASVMASTTLPALLLGGDPGGNEGLLRERWADALALPGVRGLVAGRSLLYPADEDVEHAVDAAAALVHAA